MLRTAHEESSVDDQNAAVHEYFALPIAPRNPGAHGIARGIAQQCHLIVAHVRNRTQGRASIKHVYVPYHADKNPGTLVVATDVSAYSHGCLALDKKYYSSRPVSAHPRIAGISHVPYVPC